MTTWEKIKDWFAAAAWMGSAVAMFGFCLLYVFFPLIVGFSILYVIFHFLHKIW